MVDLGSIKPEVPVAILREQLKEMMKKRNYSAHASFDGRLREIDPNEYYSLAKNFELFIRTLVEVAIGERCLRERGPK